MTWEYLANKTYRYDIIKEHARDLGHVVELCNGAGALEGYLDCASYTGCDRVGGVLDDEFVRNIKKCDTLIALGHGGYEIDKNPLESATLTNSILYVMKAYKPKVLILESVDNYQSIINGIVKNTDYVESYKHNATGAKWTDKRTLRIFTKSSVLDTETRWKPPISNNDGLWIDVKIPYEPGYKLADAYNRSMENTTAEWVLFLDHDLFICNPHWYGMCLDAIRQLEGQKVGWITAVCNRIGGGPQLKAPPQDSDDILYHAKIAEEYYKKYGNKIEHITYDLSGFFILTNKTSWRDIGGFRHMNKKILGIDNDYRKRLAEKGYRLFIMKGLYFYHLYRGKAKAFKGFYEN